MPLFMKASFTYFTTLFFLFNLLSTVKANDSLKVNADTAISVSSNKKIVEENTAKNSTKKIYVFKIHQEIGPGATRITEKAIASAENMNADFLVVDLDTYGGLVDDADKIRTALLNTKITTLVFIRNNAASAGALISIACDSIYMKTGSTIGAAAVVNQTGEVMPEKYQSYMRNKMRATAEATNRNADIAEGMVDQRVVIEGITDSTEIITFSVDEAIKHGFCNSKAESVEDIFAVMGIADYEITEHKVSKLENLIQFLINPAFSGILLLIIIGGIYFELQTPGVGFPILASLVAAMLYFAPLYLEGLAANWEILLFFVGVILLAVEIFVLPGFGIAGILGLVAMITSLSLAMVRNLDGFDFSFVPTNELTTSFLLVSTVLIGGTMLILFTSDQISRKRMLGRLSLREELTKESGNVIGNAISDISLIGKIGTATTDLRPTGKIEIEGETHDAQSDGEFIGKNTTVIVLQVRGAYLLVKEN